MKQMRARVLIVMGVVLLQGQMPASSQWFKASLLAKHGPRRKRRNRRVRKWRKHQRKRKRRRLGVAKQVVLGLLRLKAEQTLQPKLFVKS
jgi:hypothetical protein